MTKNSEEERKNASTDIIGVLKNNKMYINEKKMRIDAIYKLYELGYYEKNISYEEELCYNKIGEYKR